MPLLGDLNQSSLDSFESESDSKESKDDRLNLPKNGIWDFSNRPNRSNDVGGVDK